MRRSHTDARRGRDRTRSGKRQQARDLLTLFRFFLPSSVCRDRARPYAWLGMPLGRHFKPMCRVRTEFHGHPYSVTNAEPAVVGPSRNEDLCVISANRDVPCSVYLLIACTASWRETGENSVAHEIVCTSSRHFKYTSLAELPPSRTFAATIQMTVTANGERSRRES